MISKININNVASFNESDHLMDNLGRINFIFGANGSGKTTISKVLAHPENYPSCSIAWKDDQVLPCKVYNADFVESTFTNISEMPGIFTLGQAERDVHDKITQTKTLIYEAEQLKRAATIALQGENGKSGKRGELIMVRQQYKDRVWKQKQKYDMSPIKAGLAGFLNNKENFCNEVTRHYEKNRQKRIDYPELKERALTIFGKNTSAIDLIEEPDFSKIISLNESAILSKRVIGKEDVDIGALIKKLGNSDWVKSGIEYIDLSEGLCPFCQRTLSDTFKSQLEEYFDESYLAALQEIEALIKKYLEYSQQLIEQLDKTVQLNSSFVDNVMLQAEIAKLSRVFDNNNRLLREKHANASVPVQLFDCTACSELIVKVIREANNKIIHHNKVVANISKEEKNLKAQIWQFITDEIKNEISDYLSKEAELKGEISTLKTNIDGYNKKIEDLKKELEQLQGSLTSVVPMKDRINHQLEEFGFTGFRLALGADEHSYSIVRENNVPVEKTLSEGERNFIAFLYFYSTLKGSLESSGTIDNGIVVIDDPVSSMDNDALFIISILIRELFEDVCNERGNITQLFVLSHNTYFYKEVSFTHGLPRALCNQMKYWIVRKIDGVSNIEYRSNNPIRSTYEVLWDEVRMAKTYSESYNNNALQNTMRRILEHYYKYYGGVEFRDIYSRVDSRYRCIVKSLVSWINAGSHSSFDDVCCSPLSEGSVQLYLEAFRMIFFKMGHIAHYNMMMRINEEEQDNGQAENAQS